MRGEEGVNLKRLNKDEALTWGFYVRNTRQFVKDYGLMAMRIERVGLSGVELEVFEERLAMIHDKVIEIMMRKSDMEAWKMKSDVAIGGDE